MAISKKDFLNRNKQKREQDAVNAESFSGLEDLAELSDNKEPEIEVPQFNLANENEEPEEFSFPNPEDFGDIKREEENPTFELNEEFVQAKVQEKQTPIDLSDFAPEDSPILDIIGDGDSHVIIEEPVVTHQPQNQHVSPIIEEAPLPEVATKQAVPEPKPEAKPQPVPEPIMEEPVTPIETQPKQVTKSVSTPQPIIEEEAEVKKTVRKRGPQNNTAKTKERKMARPSNAKKDPEVSQLTKTLAAALITEGRKVVKTNNLSQQDLAEVWDYIESKVNA